MPFKNLATGIRKLNADRNKTIPIGKDTIIVV